MKTINNGDTVCHTVEFCWTVAGDVGDLVIRTVMDNWFCGVDKKDKRAYLLGFNEIDENVFDDRSIALKRIHNAEQKYPHINGETYYEEY